jgi:hypothetical protein
MSITPILSQTTTETSSVIIDVTLLELDYIISCTDTKLSTLILQYTFLLDEVTDKMIIHSIACNLSMLYNEVAKRAINSQWESFKN